MSNLAALKARLISKREGRKGYECHGPKAYDMPITGWNPASDTGSRWVESLDGAGLRLVGYADEFARIGHTGWFTDSELQDETLRGVVLQLPSRGGCPLYLAGYESKSADGYRLDMSRGVFEGPRGGEQIDRDCISDGLRGAARAADRFAEIAAESEREYQDAWRLGSDYAQLAEDMGRARKAALALFADLKKARLAFAPGDVPSLCATIRASILGLRASIEDMREKRESILKDNYFRGVSAEAFNDGAGECVV